MKSLLRFLRLLAFMAGATPALANPADWEEANRSFEAGDFPAARERYEKLAIGGERSANLFFNLGNTHFRLRDLGRAALFYERALALEPGHPEAARNLAVTRTQAGAKEMPAGWADRLLAPWPVDTFTLLAAIAGWAAVFCALAIFLSKGRARRWTSAFVLCAALCAYTGWAAWRSTHRAETLAIVVATNVVARLQPAVTAGVSESLPPGSHVQVLGERGDWIYCELPGAGRGWLPAAALGKVNSSAS